MASPGAFSTCDLCDRHGERVRVLALPWRDYGGRAAFCGPVATVLAFEDNSRVREAVNAAGEGRVLVVDGGGSLRRSMLGDQLAEAAVANGWAGVVVAGAVRDVAALARLDLGVRALGASPRRTDKRGQGLRDVALEIGGAAIAPGDLLWADADGIVVADGALDSP
ncbi:ribonuclease E activity regulator RraA [Luteimonas huabeiensis]|uniref:ribonuclease E activity regulator RraA n=1 Tax=Luteimonas huabeiensis TaxID=1244513 RepID=UPI0004672583|nr:ribonuclease E activity regulator RraA [Luteimonas huabeiensis]